VAYNYQVVAKDDGVWVHHPTYAIQLLHGGIESLAGQMVVKIGELTVNRHARLPPVLG